MLSGDSSVVIGVDLSFIARLVATNVMTKVARLETATMETIQ
jgi:hypothetical protein